MKVYITFEQIHTHSINGKTFDKNCIGVLEADNVVDGYCRAMNLFNKQFHRALGEKPDMSYFPRGLIEL